MLEVECGFPDHPENLVLNGPTLKVLIGFDPDYRPRGGTPRLDSNDYIALIDTGATTSCIDSSVAAALGLPAVDQRPVSGVHGQANVNVHLAQIHITDLEYTQYGQFCGVHLRAGGQPHSALLGRTFLHDISMTYRGASGSVILACERDAA